MRKLAIFSVFLAVFGGAFGGAFAEIKMAGDVIRTGNYSTASCKKQSDSACSGDNKLDVAGVKYCCTDVGNKTKQGYSNHCFENEILTTYDSANDRCYRAVCNDLPGSEYWTVAEITGTNVCNGYRSSIGKSTTAAKPLPTPVYDNKPASPAKPANTNIGTTMCIGENGARYMPNSSSSCKTSDGKDGMKICQANGKWSACVASTGNMPEVTIFECSNATNAKLKQIQKEYALDTEIQELVTKLLNCCERKDCTNSDFNSMMIQLDALIAKYKKDADKKNQNAAFTTSISRIAAAFTTVNTTVEVFEADASVWKNAEGNFNTSRLVSDSVAGVVLGTAGGLITSNIIKKNQIENGFEDMSCTVGGQVVAGWGDEFRVGVR